MWLKNDDESIAVYLPGGNYTRPKYITSTLTELVRKNLILLQVLGMC